MLFQRPQAYSLCMDPKCVLGCPILLVQKLRHRDGKYGIQGTQLTSNKQDLNPRPALLFHSLAVWQ